MTRNTMLATALLALLLLAACGQKGPLFLPGNPSEVRTDVPPAEAEPDDDEEDDDQQR